MPSTNTHFVVVGFRAGNWNEPVQVNIPLAELQAIIDARVAALAVPTTETDMSDLATEATLAQVKTCACNTATNTADLATDTGTLATDLATVKADIALIKSSIANVETDIGLIQDEIPAKDDYVDAAPVLEIEHHMVHNGKHFFCRDFNEIGSGSSIDYLITTPASGYMHFTPIFDFTAITTIAFYAGANRNGTSALTVHNNNATSANVSTLTIHKGTSGGTTDGVLVCSYKSGIAAGAATRIGGEVQAGQELILAQSTKYLFRVTSATAGNLVNALFMHYEA